METVAVVNDQYSVAAGVHVPMACCPGVGYDKKLLAAIPEAVLERDYGCGDPTSWVRPGETVLDLGSGGGKMCFVVSQLVGKSGRVIGVDMNDEMLDLARSAAMDVAARVGHANVEFRKGYIDDLKLDLQALDDYLRDNPIDDANSYQAMDSMLSEIRAGCPLVADSSVDVVLSNCVLNLVSVEKRKNLFREIYRVLQQGGRAVISDVVSDQPVPAALRKSAHLWSTCVSGAMEEGEFLEAFAEAGFHGITLESRAVDPYLEVEGVQFRTVTVSAYKGKEGPCWEGYQAVCSIADHSTRWKTMTAIDLSGARGLLCVRKPSSYWDESPTPACSNKSNLRSKFQRVNAVPLNAAKRAAGATPVNRRTVCAPRRRIPRADLRVARVVVESAGGINETRSI